MEHEENTFEVVDKRRGNTQANDSEQPAEAPATHEHKHEHEHEQEGAMPDLDVFQLLGSFVGMLNGFAWQKMGMIANPATGQIETDLAQAKVAIDSMQFLVGQLESHISEGEMREIRRVLMDLQMNYVRRSGSGG